MEWLIIIFVLIFVSAPVMWLKPSPRQKRQGVLRNCAAEYGISVKLEKPPLHHFKGLMPAYRWYYPQAAPGPDFLLVRDSNASSALERYCAGWRWRIAPLRPLPQAAEQNLKELLERLPQDALVVESSSTGLALWWWESQTAERLRVYAAAFDQLRSELGGLADDPIQKGFDAPNRDASPVP
ncbi:preprotein translocase subunit YajC [Halomonas sp.]|uniref:preprotein translocase subunit YajC n=1 Tax=Halomonas sp. TaxID=1486246 RepID=UPI003A91E13B